MVEEAILEFRLREIDKTRENLLEEIKQWFHKWKI